MRPKTKLYYKECRVAGRQYYEAAEVWDKLKVGDLLELEHEADNRHDADAVAVLYRDPDTDELFQLGYVPRGENHELALFLQMGHAPIFECRLARKNPDEHYEQQLTIVIKIKRRPASDALEL